MTESTGVGTPCHSPRLVDTFRGDMPGVAMAKATTSVINKYGTARFKMLVLEWKFAAPGFFQGRISCKVTKKFSKRGEEVDSFSEGGRWVGLGEEVVEEVEAAKGFGAVAGEFGTHTVD